MRPMPNSCAKSPHAAPSRSQGVLSASAPQRCFCEPGHLTASETKPVSAGRLRNSSGDRELAFFGHPLESFCRAFDPVLAVVSVGRQQADHLVGAAGGRTGNVAGSKIYSLSNAEFVLQRPLHHAKNAGRAHGPRCDLPAGNRRWYSTPPTALASNIGTWQTRFFCRFFSAINALPRDSGSA